MMIINLVAQKFNPKLQHVVKINKVDRESRESLHSFSFYSEWRAY